MPARKPNFALQAAPFLFMMAIGSWGLSQFLKLPVQLKDDRARRRREGREKFDLQKEHEVRACFSAERTPSSPRFPYAAVCGCSADASLQTLPASQKLQATLHHEADHYENIRVPGPRNPNRKPAD
jgi:hypothetical protein